MDHYTLVFIQSYVDLRTLSICPLFLHSRDYITELILPPEYNTNSLHNFKNLQTLLCDNNYLITNETIKNLKSLTELDKSYNPNFTDDGICGLVNLKKLICKGTHRFSGWVAKDTCRRLTDKTLYNLQNLTYLDCGENNFTDDGINQLKQLVTLKCGKNRFSDNAIGNLLRLKHLYCDDNFRFTDNAILNLTQLETLYCGQNSDFTDVGISKLVLLKKLSLDMTSKVTNDGVKNCTLLEYLNVGHNNINDNALQKMSNLIELHCTNFNSAFGGYMFGYLTDECLQYVPNLKHLVCSKDFTNEAVGKLRSLRVLICAKNTNLTDDVLYKLPLLEELYIGSSIFSNNGISSLRNLRVLQCPSGITNECIIGLTNLEKLNCDRCESLTDNIFEHLPNLRSLKCNRTFTDKGVSKLKNLHALYLGENNNVTNDGIKHMIFLQGLFIDDNMNITGDGISQLTNLIELDCGNNVKITTESLRNLKQLRIISNTKYDETLITDEIMTYLPHLRCTYTRGTYVI
jgi:hypothetical protein